MGRAPVVARVRRAVAQALGAETDVVLAVSGGRDSAVLLDAALAVAADRVRLVATFDHGTGPAATRAAGLVRALARAAGVPCRVGRGTTDAASEAEWRTMRWRFLRRAARAVERRTGRSGAVVATGHTVDDQLETVVMRLLRGAGVRGLAAMYAPQPGIVRPLLAIATADVAAYAAARELAWVTDPSNDSRRFLRNRIRHELLPALRAIDPTLDAGLLGAARAATGCRLALDALAERLAGDAVGAESGAVTGGVPVARVAELRDVPEPALAVLWPALAARAGVRLDRRGTECLAAFTTVCVTAVRGGAPPPPGRTVVGGVQVAVERRGALRAAHWVLVVRPRARRGRSVEAPPATVSPLPAGEQVRLGAWQLRALDRAPTAGEVDEGRVAWLSSDRRYVVRSWAAGDRWSPAPGVAARRVKRFFADRRVPAAARAGWPVVAVAAAPDGSGGEIVWVPGVRRSSAAPARPGQPGFYLLCERTPERCVRL